MKQLKTVFLFFIPFALYANDMLEDLSYGKDCLYQDILVNGKVIYQGDRECEARYQALKPVLDQYKRPITVLDIGANNGYFSLRLADEYDATAIMIDFTDRLEKICSYNTKLDNIIYLKKQLTTEDLKELNRKEHFDVILLFHVLHHIAPPDNWKDFLSEIFKLADNVIIQTPPENDGHLTDKPNIPAIAKYLLSHQKNQEIGSFIRQSNEIRDHMLWFCFKPKETYVSLYNNPAKQGISLTSFKKLHGRYPSKEKIQDERKKLPFYKRYFKEAITVYGNHLD